MNGSHARVWLTRADEQQAPPDGNPPSIMNLSQLLGSHYGNSG